MTTAGTLFGASNLDALLSHLPDASLSAEIVAAVRSAATEGEARVAIQALTQDRIDQERQKLDAKTTSA